jgi:RNA polymerase sigma-70 factor (ECF subfamily)
MSGASFAPPLTPSTPQRIIRRGFDAIALANHHTDGLPADDEGGAIHDRPDAADEPTDLERWSEFHAQVEALPDEEREVVNLIFYEALTQEEAAHVLGVSLRTVKRRWQSARCRLYEKLNEA